MTKTYTTYVTTWGNDPLSQVVDMVNRSVIKPNTIIALAFASFNFSSTDYIPGLTNTTMDTVKQVINIVHS